LRTYASRVQQISKLAQIDPKIIYSNKEKWKDWDNEKQIYLSLFDRKKNGNYKYPWTANHLMTNPLLLKQVDNNEIHNLQNIEDIILSHNGSWLERTPHLFYEGMKDIVKGGLGTVQAYTEFFANPTDVKRSPFFTEEQNKQLDIIFSPENIKKRDEEIREYFDILRNETNLRSRPLRNIGGTGQFYNDFIQMLPQMGATIASGIVAGPAAGAGFMGQYIGGSDYGGKRDRGISKERALVGSAFNAASQSALEYVGLSSLLKLIKTTGGAKKVLVNFFKTLITEGGTEALQAYPESISEIWGEGELKKQSLGEMVKSFVEKLPETTRQGLYEGLIVTPFALFGGAASLPGNIKHERKLKQERQKYNKLAGVAESSKLRDINPEQFASLIDEQLEKDQINSSKFYIDYSDYVNMFESPKEAAEMAGKLGIEADIEKSLSSGKQIPIQMGKWQAYNRTVDENSFYKNARPEEDGKTFIEMQREMHNEKDTQKETLDQLIEYYKKTATGKIVFEELDIYTLQDKIDSGELTEIEAEKLIEDHGWEGKKTPSQVNILGSNKADETILIDGKEHTKYIVKLAKGASPYTVIEEVSEAWFKDKFNYNLAKDEFADKDFQTLLETEREKASKNGYITSENNIEWLSTIAINYAKNNSDRVFNSFSDKFKKQIKKIASYIKELLTGADKVKELIDKGVLTDEFINIIDKAVGGDFDVEFNKKTTENFSEVKEAKNSLDEIKNNRNRKTFNTSSLLKDSLVIDKIYELGGMSRKPKNYKGGEYDDQIAFRDTKGFGRFIYSGTEGQNTPDRMAQILYDEKLISEPTVNEMWLSIQGEITNHGKITKNNDGETNNFKLNEEEQKEESFKSDTGEKTNLNSKAIKAEQLKVGDVVTIKSSSEWQIKNEEMEVIDVDPETFEVTLKDGQRYGVQKIQDGETIYAAKIDEGEALNDGMETFQMQTKKPAFKSWFGDSKVVDESGKPLVVYHGTNADFKSFRQSDIGIHLGTFKQANRRVYSAKDKVIMALYATIKKPLVIGNDYGNWSGNSLADRFLSSNFFKDSKINEDIASVLKIDRAKGGFSTSKLKDNAMRKVLIDLGYDGIKYPNHFEGKGDSYIAFEPAQIKSATGNNGNFDGNNPDITFQLSSREISTFDLPDSLAKVTVQTNFSTLTKQPEYNEAKRSGDNKAAFDIVNKLIKKKKIDELKAKLDPNKPVYIIPISNYEKSKQLNRLPYFYAAALQDAGVGNVFDEIVKKSDTPNTGKTQIARLSTKHEYVGDIPDKNAQYIIVDDMFTSGNTIMPLIELIKKQGGEVAAVSSLAFSRYGTSLKLKQETLDKIIKNAKIKDRKLITILTKATQNEGNIIYDYIRKRKNTTERDIRSFIDPQGSQRNNERSTGDVPPTSHQLISAENLVNSYIQNYEKIDKLKNTFDKFGAVFYSEDAYELKFDLLKAISTITGRELPRAAVLAELTGGASVQKSLKSKNIRNAVKAAEDNYVRETKQWIKANKLPHHVVMERLSQGDLTLGNMEAILDSIKGRLRIKDSVIKKERDKSKKRKKKFDARKKEINHEINNTTEKNKKLSSSQSQTVDQVQQTTKYTPKAVDDINIDNIKEELEHLQREMATLVSALPKAEQWKMKNRIATITGKYGDDKKVRGYFQSTLKSMDRLIAEYKKNNAIEEIADQIKSFTNKKDHRGRRIGKTIPKTQKRVGMIRDIIFEGTEKIQKRINDLTALSKDREFTEEEIEDLSIILTFGNIKRKNSEDVLKAQAELRSIITDGLMTRLIFTESDKKRDEENRLKAIDNITGGKGLLKGQAKKDRELKHKSYLWNLASKPGNYQFKHLGFELEMNALSRQDIESEHLDSWLVKKFAKDVHVASQTENTGTRERSTEHINAIKKIFSVKNNRALFKKFKEFSVVKESNMQIYEMDHEKFEFTFEQTAQLLIDYFNGKLHKKYDKYEFRAEKMISIQEELDRRIARQHVGLPVNEVFEIEFDEKSGEKWNLKLSQDEAVNYWLLLQQDYTENFFYNGWDDVSIKELEKFMSVESKEYALELQSFYDKQYDPMNKVYKTHFHIDMPKIDNYSKAVFEYSEKDSEINPDQIAGGGSVGTTANPVSIIQRQKHTRNPKQMGTSVVYTQSIFESEHFKAFAGVAKELKGTFKDGKVREAIKENYGTKKLEAVNYHIDQLIQGGINSDKINKSIDLLRSSVTRAFA
jgi:hypothetical protein